MEVLYDLEQVELHDAEDPLLRYFDLLPVLDRGHLVKDFLARTPCIHARRLGELLGLPWLYLKDETGLPTKTTKDRMASVALPYLYECGVRHFAISSTGNSSTSFARLISHYPGVHMYLFTAEDFLDRVSCAHGSQSIHFAARDATFADACAIAMSFARRRGIQPEHGFFNPARREGLKLAFLEAVEQIPRPVEWYFQAISSAMGVVGTFKGARELLGLGRLKVLPRLVSCQLNYVG